MGRTSSTRTSSTRTSSMRTSLTLLTPHPMGKTLIAPQVMMSQVLSSYTCHEPYYAPVPQVDRGHQGHLGAGDRHHVLVVSLHYCQIEEKNSASTNDFYFQLQLFESFISIVIKSFLCYP